jgi:hypothetical protein
LLEKDEKTKFVFGEESWMAIFDHQLFIHFNFL